MRRVHCRRCPGGSTEPTSASTPRRTGRQRGLRKRTGHRDAPGWLDRRPPWVLADANHGIRTPGPRGRLDALRRSVHRGHRRCYGKLPGRRRGQLARRDPLRGALGHAGDVGQDAYPPARGYNPGQPQEPEHARRAARGRGLRALQQGARLYCRGQPSDDHGEREPAAGGYAFGAGEFGDGYYRFGTAHGDEIMRVRLEKMLKERKDCAACFFCFGCYAKEIAELEALIASGDYYSAQKARRAKSSNYDGGGCGGGACAACGAAACGGGAGELRRGAAASCGGGGCGGGGAAAAGRRRRWARRRSRVWWRRAHGGGPLNHHHHHEVP